MLGVSADIIKRYFAIGTELIWVVFAHVATLIGGLLTIKLLSNLLSEIEFGIYALLFSVVSLVVSVLFSGLGHVNMRFLVLTQQEGTLAHFRRDQNHLLLFIAGLSLLFLIPCAIVLHQDDTGILITYIALALLVLAMGVQSVQQFLLMAFRLRFEASITQVIGAIIRPLCVFLLMWYCGYNALVAVFGLALGFALLSLSQYHFLNKSWTNAIKENEKIADQDKQAYPPVRDFLSYGLFYGLIGLVSAVVLNVDRWILSTNGNLEQVAIYAALMQVGLAPTAFSFAIVNRLVSPIYFKTRTASKKVQNKHFSTMFFFWLLTCFVLLIVTWQLHHWLVQTMTNERFADYSYLLPWIVLGFLFERTSQVLEMKGALALKTNTYIYPRLIIVGLVPVLEYLFFHYMGFEQLVFGLVAGTATGTVLIAFINYNQSHHKN